MSAPGIFISYRRAETASIAGRIRDRLLAVFGPNIFLDVETLYAGQDWAATIDKRIRQSDAVLALIGSQWLTIAGPDGAPRLQNPGDPVRHELGFAHQIGCLVIPVCVNGAPVPTAGQLPENLRWLPGLNVQQINDSDFNHGIDLLIQALERHGLTRYRPDEWTPLPFPPSSDVLPDPGPLPPGSRLPFPRNAIFTGREGDLLALAKTLFYERRPAAVSQPAGLTGMGGLGKTQLAVELCYRYGRFLHGVHWINATQSIESEIAACGLAMNLQPWSDKLPEQLSLTLQAWARQPGRLLALDNLEDPAVLQEWLPRLGGLPLLVTSRCTEWPADLGLAILPLQTLPSPESRALLRKLCPRLGAAPDAEVDRLASRLGDLPLALDLAGRYLHDLPRLSIDGYLEELGGAVAAMGHASLKDWTQHNPTKHDTDLAHSFTLSWGRLEGDGEPGATARRLFCACGYCAPNTPIPEALLEEALELPQSEARRYAQAVKRLAALGLLERSEKGALLHPLLAEFARLQDAAAAGSALPALANALGGAAYKANMSGLPAQFLPLRPHVQAAIEHCAAPYPKEAATLLNNLGYHQNAIADYAAAKASYERALEIREKVLAEDDPLIATTFNNLGGVLHALGDYAAARAAYERALRIDEAAFGPDHPDVATDVNNLGSVLQDIGDYPAARAAYERALRIDEAAFGPDHPKVAIRVNNLGGVLKALGDYAAARAAFERALRIDEAAFGPDHPNVASDVNNLGSVLQALGDYPAARAAYERALRIDEAAFGPDHPDIARDVNNLGNVLHALGDYPAARAAFERALRIDEAAFGPDHPNVASDVNNLGSVLHALGDYPAARAAYERALRIDEAAFGPDHPKVAIRVNNLGGVLKALGDYAAARAAYERALRIVEKELGPNHPYVAASNNNLGSVLQALGDYPAARAAYERALRIDEAAFGPDHPNVAIDVNNLGGVLQALGETPAARAAYERALRIRRVSLGENHPDTAQSYWWLGTIAAQEKDFERARRYYQQALSVFESVLGTDHPNTKGVRNYLASLPEE